MPNAVQRGTACPHDTNKPLAALRPQLRQLQNQIRAEEDWLRERARRAVKARAEGELAGRVAAFHARSVAKEDEATRRKQARVLRALCMAELHAAQQGRGKGRIAQHAQRQALTQCSLRTPFNLGRAAWS